MHKCQDIYKSNISSMTSAATAESLASAAGRPPLSGNATIITGLAEPSTGPTSADTSATAPTSLAKIKPATDLTNTIVSSPSESPATDMFDSAQTQTQVDAADSTSREQTNAEPTPNNATSTIANAAPSDENFATNLADKPLKILFLSSDTGGGHRASALSLANQFEILFPGSTYDLLDVVASDGVPPYNSLTSWYSHLSGHPAQWKLVYGVSNSKAFELMADVHLKIMCERAMRKRILSYEPDVVVSVHPLMCNVPALACKKIEQKTGRHLPMFTVVTDLGSAHCLWFANTVDRLFVASDACYDLAKTRGKCADETIRKIGLPIRNDFAVLAKAMGEDRLSEQAVEYRMGLRKKLGLSESACSDPNHRVLLVMGGGEGCGALGNIVDALYVELCSRGPDMNATIVVICGRNASLKAHFDGRDWEAVMATYRQLKARAGYSWMDKVGVMEGCPDITQYSLKAASTVLSGDQAAASGAAGGTVGVGRYSLPPIKGCFPKLPSFAMGCVEGNVAKHLQRILSNTTLENAITTSLPPSEASTEVPSEVASRDESDAAEAKTEGATGDRINASPPSTSPVAKNEGEKDMTHATDMATDEPSGNVSVMGLGFVTNMAEYMVAADVLVSKAGPGTIAEAAAVSLPVMLTSFLPGQEEGNVDFVVNNGFGAFVSDSDPMGVAEVVTSWLLDDLKMKELSQAASACGAPNAAAEIVKAIGEETFEWREKNLRNELKRKEEEEAKKAAASEAEASGKDADGRVIGGIRRIYHSFSNLTGAATTVDADASNDNKEIDANKETTPSDEDENAIKAPVEEIKATEQDEK